MGTINAIFRRHGDDYLKHTPNLTFEQRKVIRAMSECRSGEQGMIVYHCDACNRPHEIARGCGNRHCPGCQHHKGQLWLQRRLACQLPGPHFMLTFTVPEGLRAFLMRYPRVGYDALFAASAFAIKTLAADPRWIGGDLPGFFGVLHTWGRQLQYHPHIHYVAVGGAWCSRNHRWYAASEGFFLPVHALSKVFRGQFRDLMRQKGLLMHIPDSVWACAWNVNSQAVGSAEATLKYLTPYVFRVAISDHRIVKVDDVSVSFWYQDRASRRRRTLTLPVFEFMRRFLQHVLPTGFMKIRYFGCLSPSASVSLEELRISIEIAYGFAVSTPSVGVSAVVPPVCPVCGRPLRYCGLVLVNPRGRLLMAPVTGPPSLRTA